MGSVEHNSYGTVWLSLVGIIFLVGAGFGLSQLRDSVLTAGGQKLSNSEIKDQIRAGNRRIEELHYTAGKLQKRQALNNKRQASEQELKDLKRQILAIQDEIPVLKKNLAEEKEAALKLAEDFKMYRNRVRPLRWASAKGRMLENLVNPSGGNYEDARITLVTAEGITIQHRNGTSRLTIHQLPEKIREEYDLDPAEAREIRNNRAQAEANRRKAIKELPPNNPKLRTKRTKSMDVEKYFKPDR